MENKYTQTRTHVVICFHFSIFEPLETVERIQTVLQKLLWFAFILVSLNHWKQCRNRKAVTKTVVICFHFSIFEPLETVNTGTYVSAPSLWFAFILVSLNHWKQYILRKNGEKDVVICFHFSIFEPLETVAAEYYNQMSQLWFAFILVSLNHWKQWSISDIFRLRSCDLLSF